MVDFDDSQDPKKTRNAEIQACTSDLAVVGTSAALLTTVDEMHNRKNKAGMTTGIPDIPR